MRLWGASCWDAKDKNQLCNPIVFSFQRKHQYFPLSLRVPDFSKDTQQVSGT